MVLSRVSVGFCYLFGRVVGGFVVWLTWWLVLFSGGVCWCVINSVVLI